MKKIKILEGIKLAHKGIKVHDTLKEALRYIIDHLKHCVQERTIDWEDICTNIVITPSGNIFKPSGAIDKVHASNLTGVGVLINIENEIIEGNFSYGTLKTGYAWIINNKGEYYEGSVLEKGIKHGTGKYWYSNGDFYS